MKPHTSHVENEEQNGKGTAQTEKTIIKINNMTLLFSIIFD